MINVGSSIRLPISDMGRTVTLEVAKIEKGIAYFGKCIKGQIPISEIICEDGEVIEVGAIMETDLRDTKFELKLEIGRIENETVYFSRCTEGSVPEGYLTFIANADLFNGMSLKYPQY